MRKPIPLLINGARYRLEVDPTRALLEVLREDLDLTGTKYGCGEGQCGACTVLVDGRPTRSCLLTVEAAAGKSITTIEGLASDGKLHAVQQALIDADAMQCGYCTAGIVMSAVALLAKNANPTDADIIRQLDGNLCRCGTYPRLVTAIRRAAKGGAR